jgi:hypothetical protein
VRREPTREFDTVLRKPLAISFILHDRIRNTAADTKRFDRRGQISILLVNDKPLDHLSIVPRDSQRRRLNSQVGEIARRGTLYGSTAHNRRYSDLLRCMRLDRLSETIEVQDRLALRPNFGPSEIKFFRLSHDGGLAAPRDSVA